MLDRCTCSAPPSGNGRRVLIVEDEPIVAFYLEDMIAALGHEPAAVVATVDQALEWLETGRPDFAVLDVNLRGNKSYPVADRLKALEISYVFATGYGATEHPPEHRNIATLTKPYRESDLRSLIDE